MRAHRCDSSTWRTPSPIPAPRRLGIVRRCPRLWFPISCRGLANNAECSPGKTASLPGRRTALCTLCFAIQNTFPRYRKVASISHSGKAGRVQTRFSVMTTFFFSKPPPRSSLLNEREVFLRHLLQQGTIPDSRRRNRRHVASDVVRSTRLRDRATHGGSCQPSAQPLHLTVLP